MNILRNYQKELGSQGADIIRASGIVYFMMEPRTGKTLTALECAKEVGVKKVIFITKKKAISSIQNDYNNFGYHEHFSLRVINRESVHLIPARHDFDLVVYDEAHGFGGFPKPSEYAKYCKKMFGHLPTILMSGTPHPESYSQLFHQFWLCNQGPWIKNPTFYNWYDDIGFPRVTKNIGYGKVFDWSCRPDSLKTYAGDSKEAIEKRKEAIKKINHIMEIYSIKYSQKEAGFVTVVEEEILYCKMSDKMHEIFKTFKRDKVVDLGNGTMIAASRAAEMLQKMHQFSSGTILDSNGQAHILDFSKAEFIKKFFGGKKIVIFYKYKAEKKLLEYVFSDQLTDQVNTFLDNPKLNLCLQYTSGREGLNLSVADHIVFFNIDYSAVSYFQAKDRMTTINRKTNKVFYVFSDLGLEEKVYKSVSAKKTYTNTVFKRDFKL